MNKSKGANAWTWLHPIQWSGPYTSQGGKRINTPPSRMSDWPWMQSRLVTHRPLTGASVAYVSRTGRKPICPPRQMLTKQEIVTTWSREGILPSFTHWPPTKFDPMRPDNGCDIQDSLREDRAYYHENCRPLFNNTVRQSQEKIHPSIK